MQHMVEEITLEGTIMVIRCTDREMRNRIFEHLNDFLIKEYGYRETKKKFPKRTPEES